MSRDGVFSREKKTQIKNELEDLLRGYSGDETGSNDNVDQQLAEIAAAPPLDFDQMNREFEKQAKSITNSMLKFYVDLGIIEKHDYAKEKQRLDNSSIQNIFFQLKTLRMAIEKIAEEINQGNTHPRLFEVFGQLQDKLTAVVKTQANYVLFLEDTYRKMKQEVELIENGGDSQQSKSLTSRKSDEYYISAGTKNLMKEIDVEDVTDEDQEEEEADKRNLTHPARKAEIMLARGLADAIAKDEEPDNLFDDVDSLI